MLAIILLVIGGLGALQAGAVSMGLPFCVILIGVMVCLVKALDQENAMRVNASRHGSGK
jgi:choline-glycine betaine transporter